MTVCVILLPMQAGVFLFLFVSLVTNATQAGANYNYVGQIFLKEARPADGEWVGTAFLVDAQKGLLLTNLHNLYTCAKRLGIGASLRDDVLVGKTCDRHILKVQFPLLQERTEAFGATVLAHGNIDLDSPDSYDDWALLRIACEDCKSQIVAPVIAAVLPNDGEKIAVVGNPAVAVGERISNDARVYLSRGLARSRENIVNYFHHAYHAVGVPGNAITALFDFATRKFFQYEQQFYHNAPIYPGYSGGPILNEAGEVVAIHWGTVAVWKKKFGPRPQALKLDYRHAYRPGNQMSAGRELVSWLPAKLAEF